MSIINALSVQFCWKLILIQLNTQIYFRICSQFARSDHSAQHLVKLYIKFTITRKTSSYSKTQDSTWNKLCWFQWLQSQVNRQRQIKHCPLFQSKYRQNENTVLQFKYLMIYLIIITFHVILFLLCPLYKNRKRMIKVISTEINERIHTLHDSR